MLEFLIASSLIIIVVVASALLVCGAMWLGELGDQIDMRRAEEEAKAADVKRKVEQWRRGESPDWR